MIIHGSITHDYSGRKRKTVATRTRKRTPRFVDLEPSLPAAYRPNEYPSCTTSPKKVEPIDQSYRQEISSKYTVAIPYYKGAYQVISPDNIEDIGK